MTYSELVQRFLEKVEVIKNLNPAYKQPGDGSNGTCDCIGLIIGALRRMGLKWTGIHGSNYAARYQTDDLQYISSESELRLGDYVYKGVGPDGRGRRPCSAGTFTHKYDLPSRYKKGNQYYDGILEDFYHVGVVSSVNPLRITHMTSPSVKVDTSVNKNGASPWNYHGKIKALVRETDGNPAPVPEPKPTPAPIPVPVPSTGSKAIVVADNGAPVKVRQYPSTSCRTWERVPCGTEVEIIDPGEDWAQINCGKRKGWYMMAKFLDVVGDGKGKY